MAYKYYTEHEADQHYLYGNEIAQILYDYYGIVSTSGKPAVQMVAAILNQLESDLGMYKIFYETRKGLRRVYPSGQYLISNISKIFSVEEGKHFIKVNGKQYNYIVSHNKNTRKIAS